MRTPSVPAIAAALVLAAGTTLTARSAAQLTDINPNNAAGDATDPDQASGGRVNGLARAPDGRTFFAATEWGGLYRSTDRGLNWAFLAGHQPLATWRVLVDPTDARTVYATSFYDGRVASVAGISVSRDGGLTWTHPATATPPVGFCAVPERHDEPSAFGIAVDPQQPRTVFVGTNCGLAISTDAGATWSFVDPTPGDRATDVWSVLPHGQGVIDICGDDGHWRSTNGGTTWTTATGVPLPTGRCSLAGSPDEPYVLFAVVGTTIFESDNAGGSWAQTLVNPFPQGRVPFVVTNNRAGAAFDLWFGDVQLHRTGCTTPAVPAPGGAARCPGPFVGPFTRAAGGHDDTGDLAFDGAAVDACPVLLASDGGVYRNTAVTSPGCQTPAWEQPNVTPHALWLWAVDGAMGLAGTDLYIGAQDNGAFATTNAGVALPPWNNPDCCDVFAATASPQRVLSTLCCFRVAPVTQILARTPGMAAAIPFTPPPGTVPGFNFSPTFARFSPAGYAATTSSGVFSTGDVTAAPIVWTQLGAATTPPGVVGVYTSRQGGTTTYFAQSGAGDGTSPLRVFRLADAAWTEVLPPGTGSFGVFAVDPRDPARMLASHLRPGMDPEMVMSRDMGRTWSGVPSLDARMNGGGVFRYRTQRGPQGFGPSLSGYQQPTLVAFDPFDSNVLVAGAVDAGVFVSFDGGSTWQTITNPLQPGPGALPHLPRPRGVFFDHESGQLNLYIGTQGRGVWRAALRSPSLRHGDGLFMYRPGRGAVWIADPQPGGGFGGLLRVGDNGAAPPNGIDAFDFLSTADQVVPVDFDGDGDEDLFVYRPGTGSIAVLRSDGTGGFTVACAAGCFVGDNGSAPPNGIGGWDFLSPADRVLALDFDADRRQDLLVYRPGTGAVAVLRSVGDGSYVPACAGCVVGDNGPAPPNGIAGFDLLSPADQVVDWDFDGDGARDLFVYRPGSGAVTVARSNRDGTFSAVLSVGDNGPALPNGIAGFDLLSPNDRVLPLRVRGRGEDLLVYRPGTGAMAVVRWAGGGSFAPACGAPCIVGDNGAAPPNGIAGFDLLSGDDRVVAFDYDGDGNDDLALYRPGRGAIYVAHANGDGTFSAVLAIGDNGPTAPNGIAGYDLLSPADRIVPFDYNGDGLQDLFLYRAGRGAAYVARSNGDGTFTAVYAVGDNGSDPDNGIAGYDLLSADDRVMKLHFAR